MTMTDTPTTTDTTDTTDTADNSKEETLRADRDFWMLRAQQLHNDLDLLADALLEEANDRGWCNEFDTFIDNINGSFKVFKIPARTARFRATITLDVTYDCNPNEADDIAEGIAGTLYAGADSMGGYTYVIQGREYSNVEQDNS